MTHAWRWAALIAAVARTVLVASQVTFQPISLDHIDEVSLLQTVKRLQTLIDKCKGRLDVIFVVDESSTVCSVSPNAYTIYASREKHTDLPCAETCWLPPIPGQGTVFYRGYEMYKYQAQQYFLYDIISHLVLGPDKVMVAIVGMNAGWTGLVEPEHYMGPRLVHDWTYDADSLGWALYTLKCTAASFPHYGMEMAQDVLAWGRKDAAKIALVLLGAMPDGGPWESAADALKADAPVISVGYSSAASHTFVTRIATDEEHAFFDPDLSATLQLLTGPEHDLFCKLACENVQSCQIFEDPHVFGFDDHRKGPFSLLETGSTVASKSKTFAGRPLNVDLFETGDFWLIRSKSVKVQGRVLISGAFKPRRPALVAVAIGGPFLQNHTLQVGTLGSQLLWQGRPLRLGNFTFTYPNGTVRFSHRKGLHKKHHLKHHFEANFSSGFRIIADRFPMHLNVKLITKKIEGEEMDGECGNFNKVHSDDGKEDLTRRMGSVRVPAEERMISLRFSARARKALRKASQKKRQEVSGNASFEASLNMTPLDVQF